MGEFDNSISKKKHGTQQDRPHQVGLVDVE